MMKIIICGSQTFTDRAYLNEACLDIIAREQYNRVIPNNQLEFVSGHAPKGADYYGEKFAIHHKFQPKLFPADWNNLEPEVPENWGNSPVLFYKPDYYGGYNALAGMLRNQRMVNYMERGDIVIAFRVGDSKGTSDMIRRSKKAGLKVYQIDYDKERKVKVWNE